MKNYTKELGFWKRLESFVSDVQTGCCAGEEEKEMIMHCCKLKILDLQNVNKRTYLNSVYRNKVDREWIVVVDKEISKTKLQMRHGEIWSKNRLSRYWEYVC